MVSTVVEPRLVMSRIMISNQGGPDRIGKVVRIAERPQQPLVETVGFAFQHVFGNQREGEQGACRGEQRDQRAGFAR